ncbi:MAG: polysaccharide deacetylase family protein [Flavobacterium sp.]|nr:polysaccharide deacetylase family protein [Flavobacterium sp.]
MVSHSYTHANLVEILIEEAKFEILKGKEILEKICTKPILEFAFPFGIYNSELVNYCKEIGISKSLLLDYNAEKDKNEATAKNRFVMNPYVNFKMQLLYLLKGKYI